MTVPPLDPQHPDADLLEWAYGQGVFPMADVQCDRIEWFCPDPRGVIPLDGFALPRSLARVVRRGPFEITSDVAFEAVMRECAAPRGDVEESWIDERLIEAYVELHGRGHAHSVEARRDGTLVGGLYGVHLGAAFFGESMFVRPDRGGRDASKVCMVHLVAHLRRRGFLLLDTQFWNPHLDQFGCVEIPRDEYLEQLAVALRRGVAWEPFEGPEPGLEFQ